eukprot:128636_1
MTAAHCFDDFYVNETTGVFNRFESEYKEGFGIRFTIGATLTPDLLNLTDIYDQLTTFDPSMFHIHPQYNKSADFIPYDIALIIFDNTSTININIDPLPTIPMQLSAQESCCYPGESLIAIGFGNNQTDGSNTATLEQTTLYVLDYATAVTLLYHFSGITDDAEIRKNIAEQDEPNRWLAADGNNTDICQGDSGGPLFRIKNETHEIVGISSWTYNGCNSDQMSGFTPVGLYYNWIMKTIDYVVYGNTWEPTVDPTMQPTGNTMSP